jgi:heme exporter protein CcmD
MGEGGRLVTDFLHMGGYAAYLWPAYLLTFAVLAWNVLSARRALREAKLEARRRFEADREDRS